MITSSLPYCIISIHAPREGGDLDFLGTVLDFIISIHAPREGGDPTIYYAYAVVAGISIHAPREGGDVSRLFDKLR